MGVTNKDVIAAINDSKDAFATAIKASEAVSKVRFDNVDEELKRIGKTGEDNTKQIVTQGREITTLQGHNVGQSARGDKHGERLDGLEGRERTSNYRQGGIAAGVTLVVAWLRDQLPSILAE